MCQQSINSLLSYQNCTDLNNETKNLTTVKFLCYVFNPSLTRLSVLLFREEAI